MKLPKVSSISKHIPSSGSTSFISSTRAVIMPCSSSGSWKVRFVSFCFFCVFCLCASTVCLLVLFLSPLETLDRPVLVLPNSFVLHNQFFSLLLCFQCKFV